MCEALYTDMANETPSKRKCTRTTCHVKIIAGKKKGLGELIRWDTTHYVKQALLLKLL